MNAPEENWRRRLFLLLLKTIPLNFSLFFALYLVREAHAVFREKANVCVVCQDRGHCRKCFVVESSNLPARALFTSKQNLACISDLPQTSPFL